MKLARIVSTILIMATGVAEAIAGPADGVGAGSSFLDGVLHPWFGIDHLLATLAIGLLVVHVEKGSIIAVPLVFLSSMMAGAGLSGSGIWLPWVEPVVAVSVVVVGTALVSGRRFPEVLLAVVAAVIGVFHGYAHGTGTPLGSLPLAFLTGLLLGATLLLALGIWIGHWIEPTSKVSRGIGVVILLGGLALVVSQFFS